MFDEKGISGLKNGPLKRKNCISGMSVITFKAANVKGEKEEVRWLYYDKALL